MSQFTEKCFEQLGPEVTPNIGTPTFRGGSSAVNIFISLLNGVNTKRKEGLTLKEFALIGANYSHYEWTKWGQFL